MATVQEEFPRRLRAARTAAGLAQREIAEAMRQRGHAQFRTSTVSYLEQGKREVLLKEAVSLAQILGQNLQELVGLGPFQEPPWSRLQESLREVSQAQEGVAQAEQQLQSASKQCERALDKAGRPLAQALDRLEKVLDPYDLWRKDGSTPSRLDLAGQVVELFRSRGQDNIFSEANPRWPKVFNALDQG